MAVASDRQADRYAAVPQVMTGFGRIDLAEDVRLGRYAFESMYRKLPDWQAVRARLDPRGVFRSDLGRMLGLC